MFWLRALAIKLDIIIIIIYHDSPPRRGSHVKLENARTIIKHTPLAHILDTCALTFSSWAIFTVYHKHQSTGGWSERTRCQAKMAVLNSIIYICTCSALLFIFRADSSVIPLLPKTTFKPSIRPNLGLLTRPPLTSAINTLLAIRYSSILSTCLSNLKVTCSILTESSKFCDLCPALLPCNTWSSGRTVLCRVQVTTSVLDLPFLTSLSLAGCGRLQLGAPHWATFVDYCK